MARLITGLADARRIAAGVACCCVVLIALSVTDARAAERFCTGNRAANSSCEGPRHYPWAATNRSTNGGWSWVWVWNQTWGGNANSCQFGNCQAKTEIGGEAYGKEQMANISGSTYYYEPWWFGHL